MNAVNFELLQICNEGKNLSERGVRLQLKYAPVNTKSAIQTVFKSQVVSPQPNAGKNKTKQKSVSLMENFYI